MAQVPSALRSADCAPGDCATSFVKLAPRHMVRNPVMFVVLVGSVLTTLVLIRDVVAAARGTGFTLQIALWLWFTVLFANFAEAMAEGRGKAQADTLRKSAHADTRPSASGEPRATASSRPRSPPVSFAYGRHRRSARPGI